MGLNASLQIGRSGVLASQAAIEVAGNNLTNLNTEGYHRRVVKVSPIRDQPLQAGIFSGRGVQLDAITRLADSALAARLRSAGSDSSLSQTRTELLDQIESIESSLGDVNLANDLTAFFDAWSELAGQPNDNSLRTLVIDQAQTLTARFQDMRSQFLNLSEQIESQTANVVRQADTLTQRIAELNDQIVQQEGGKGDGSAHSLRDQRDGLLGELASLIDISVNEQANGAADVYVGSLPIVIGAEAQGVERDTREVNGANITSVVVSFDRSPLDIRSGELGALLTFQNSDLNGAIADLDTLANQLAYQVNRAHTQGEGQQRLSSATGWAKVEDANVALDNAAATGLNHEITNGSFSIHVYQQTGDSVSQVETHIPVSLLNGGGDTLNVLAGRLNAGGNITASGTTAGGLSISSDTGDVTFAFSKDTSGALAALGINTFFQGDDAAGINVDAAIVDQPQKLSVAVAHAAPGEPTGANAAALAVAGLRDQPIAALGNVSLTQYWNEHVEDYAIRNARAVSQSEADTIVFDSLEAQRQSYSGVNADEETISLLQNQRAFQASARFITVVDELLQTLLSIV